MTKIKIANTRVVQVKQAKKELTELGISGCRDRGILSVWTGLSYPAVRTAEAIEKMTETA